MAVEEWKVNREESDLEAEKPMVEIKEENLVNHARGACLRPYKDF